MTVSALGSCRGGHMCPVFKAPVGQTTPQSMQFQRQVAALLACIVVGCEHSVLSCVVMESRQLPCAALHTPLNNTRATEIRIDFLLHSIHLGLTPQTFWCRTARVLSRKLRRLEALHVLQLYMNTFSIL